MRIVGRLVLDECVDNFFAETEQVAFCTQNIVPGIDFTNDPLLQGRNFSYLDTQIKRLGGPNFTHIPVNAPECPDAPFPAGRPHGDAQPDGPRQLRAEQVGRRRAARRSGKGLHLRYPEEVAGESARSAREIFADHYSQARQFYSSQTTVEQNHIADALIFELSKCEVLDDPRAGRGASAQHRLRISRSRWRTGWA